MSYTPTQEDWDRYYEEHSEWEDELEENYKDNWEEFADFEDIGEYFGFGNGIDSYRVVSDMINCFSWRDINDPIGFLQSFLDEIGADYDDQRLREIVIDNHELEMRDAWVDIHPEPKDPEESYEDYLATRYEDSRNDI